MDKIILGYARTSTKRQNLVSQKELLKSEFNVSEYNIFSDQSTGTRNIENRDGWIRLIKRIDKELKKGNEVKICFYSINRMSRNEKEGYNAYMDFYNRNIDLKFYLEPHLDTEKFKEDLKKANIGITGINKNESNADKLVSSILEALENFLKEQVHENIKLAFRQAQKEAEDIKNKVKQGLDNTTKRIGRPKGYDSIKKKNIPVDFGEKATRLKVAELARIYDVSRPTIYSWKKEIENGK